MAMESACVCVPGCTLTCTEVDRDTPESGFMWGNSSSRFTALDCQPGHSVSGFMRPDLRVWVYGSGFTSKVYGPRLTDQDLRSGFTER